jgi:hypothetical protein
VRVFLQELGIKLWWSGWFAFHAESEKSKLKKDPEVSQ